MNRNSKNLIEELARFVPQRDKHQVIEARAINIVVSAINLIQLISETFEAEESEELSKRLIAAIRLKDPQKFNRKIREYRKLEEQRIRDANK
jgi:uncharacterized protein (UPF0305 family)